MKILNSIYLDKNVIFQMNEFFSNEGFLKLDDFFYIDINNIRTKLLKSKYNLIYKPIICKCKKVDMNDVFDHDILEFAEYFKSRDFTEYVEEITGFELSFNSFEIFLFESGDFTLLNDETQNEEVLEVIFDMSDKFEDFMGGKVTYVTREEEVFYLRPEFNSLTILFKSDDLMKYLKYVNCLAEKRKILRILVKFNINDED